MCRIRPLVREGVSQLHLITLCSSAISFRSVGLSLSYHYARRFSVFPCLLSWSGTMASSIPLHLFPSATTYPPPPRKSSLKKPAPICVAQPQGQLRGLALQVSTGPASPPRILPATDTYKHSLFCEPTTVTVVDQSSPGLPRRQHARRRTSRPDSLIARSPGLPAEITTTQNEDRLSPLPINAQFGSSPRPSRTSSKHLIRPTVPNAIVVKEIVGAEPTVSADDDQLSPLPEKTKFSPPSPRLPEYSGALPQRSANWPTRSTSAATHKTTKSPALHAPMKSIFPEYDSGRPLAQQAYYPTNQAYAQSLPSAKVSKVSSPIRRPSIKRFDSALALVDGYEHIPFAENGDLVSLWKASNDHFPVAGRKVQLSLHQPTTRDTAITVGASANERLFSMSRTPAQTSAGEAKHWTVEKHEGSHDGVVVPVAQLTVRAQSASDDKSQAEGTAIFPQAAAVHAIEAVANSAAAAAIATFDSHRSLTASCSPGKGRSRRSAQKIRLCSHAHDPKAGQPRCSHRMLQSRPPTAGYPRHHRDEEDEVRHDSGAAGEDQHPPPLRHARSHSRRHPRPSLPRLLTRRLRAGPPRPPRPGQLIHHRHNHNRALRRGGNRKQPAAIRDHDVRSSTQTSQPFGAEVLAAQAQEV